MTVRLVAAALGCVILAGCTSSAPVDSSGSPAAARSPASSASTVRPGPKPERFDEWEVGASPLHRRPDGYGEVRLTPRELRTRRLETVDVLPPPDDGRYHATVRPVTEALVRRTEVGTCRLPDVGWPGDERFVPAALRPRPSDRARVPHDH